MSNELSHDFFPFATQPGVFIPQNTYYSGPLNGWITYVTDPLTGISWWLYQNHQWRWYDAQANVWHFAGIRTRNNNTNFFVAVISSIFLLIAGLAVGGPAIAIFLFIIVFVAIAGILNNYLRNHHPRAYQVASVIQAAAGAKAVYDLAHGAKNLLK